MATTYKTLKNSENYTYPIGVIYYEADLSAYTRLKVGNIKLIYWIAPKEFLGNQVF